MPPPAQVMRRTLTLPPKLISGMKPEGDRDSFIIVASDGVWEFISSQASLVRGSHQPSGEPSSHRHSHRHLTPPPLQAACELVAQYESATDACTALVQEAAACWKRFEGSYRDDITAIVVFLPFLEGEGEAVTDKAHPAQTTKARPPRCVRPRSRCRDARQHS